MKGIIQVIIVLLFPFCLHGQYFLEMHTLEDNSFGEWEILLEKDSSDIYGNLRLTWGMSNNLSEWQYSVDGKEGEILLKFKNNPGLWELRSEDGLITIQQTWPGDPTEWKISNGKRSFTFKTIYQNQLDDWSTEEEDLGQLVVYTERRGDPRDWIISDYMKDEITLEERMAAIFISIYTSTLNH
jgi:hypothetical protein